MDYHIEVITLPVSDVDLAVQFYTERAGFILDVDYRPNRQFRVVQLTPPGSSCSVQFGVGLTDATPGSARTTYLVVTDIEVAHRELRERGLAVSPIRHKTSTDDWQGDYSPEVDPERRNYASFIDFADQTAIPGSFKSADSRARPRPLVGGSEPMATETAKILSVNVGGVRKFDYHGRPAQSAIWKSPASGRVAARGVNLAGDRQADLEAHGGFDKAVYAYSVEDQRWWEREIGRPLSSGEFGENLTTEGMELNEALVGERWQIGTAVFEVSEPRIPCWRLGVRMNDETFPRRFSKALRPGTYLRIVVEGDVGAGDEIRVMEKPDHDLTIRDVFRIYTRDRDEVPRLLAIPQLSESWREWAEHLGRRQPKSDP